MGNCLSTTEKENYCHQLCIFLKRSITNTHLLLLCLPFGTYFIDTLPYTSKKTPLILHSPRRAVTFNKGTHIIKKGVDKKKKPPLIVFVIAFYKNPPKVMKNKKRSLQRVVFKKKTPTSKKREEMARYGLQRLQVKTSSRLKCIGSFGRKRCLSYLKEGNMATQSALKEKYPRFDMFLSHFEANKEEEEYLWSEVNTFEKKEDKEYKHLRDWFLVQEKKKARIEAVNEYQKKCPDLVPHLRARPVWKMSDFDGHAYLAERLKTFGTEANALLIQKELLSLLNNATGLEGFQCYRNAKGETYSTEATDKGQWNVFYLLLHSFDLKKNQSKCPFTFNLISNHFKEYLFDHILFSCVQSNTHILPHCGPTNKNYVFMFHC
ncbi:Aspartyl/Asparaginyl beta-hydroxylase family protein [Reticulomyxa filosa]|uniref:Aspartyl/Asparaginyl beta-hydroxylase family protein n=1 Tax=Reticulomyxa filosa TaxID=46433 RepID=X6PCS2_RETFI|nr:Aspartyl/Asparaginyl beta-hydroxylase family protein [Reticulomyxa filosa]|eukprot:ETO36320.1 Aspartyl/Asparaginyl beta-hydroxylase family protein [Reticulomyxa filosa]